jgi:Leucine-rich repeat (LRR) protein
METEGLAQIARLSRLEKLRVRVKFSDDAELAVLEKLHSLQELSLYNDNTKQEPLSLGQTAPLISANSAHFTDASLAQLARLTSLTALYLDDSSRISDAGLAHLKNLRSLEYIDLEGATSISDVGIAHLKGLTSLKYLFFSSATGIGDDGLGQLKNLKKLERLELDSTSKVTDAGVAHLEKLENLESINLSSASKVTDACVESLAKLTRLRGLDLNAKSLTDQGLNRLQAFRSLKVLTLTGVKIKGKILDDINAAIPGIMINAERIDDGEEAGAPAVPSLPAGRSPSDGASPPVTPRS